MFSYHIGVIEEGKIQIQECSEFTQHTTGTQYSGTQSLKTEKYIRSRNTGRFLIEFSFFVSDIKTLHTNFK